MHKQQRALSKRCIATVIYAVELGTTPQNESICLQVIAWSDDGETPEIMAVKHKDLPVWGVQYHPESLLTEYGHQVLLNFLLLAKVVSPDADINCVSEFNGQSVTLNNAM